MSDRAEKIRNIALIGHSGEGKTTLAEAILYNAKAIDRQGKVDDGNSTMDFDPETGTAVALQNVFSFRVDD